MSTTSNNSAEFLRSSDRMNQHPFIMRVRRSDKNDGCRAVYSHFTYKDYKVEENQELAGQAFDNILHNSSGQGTSTYDLNKKKTGAQSVPKIGADNITPNHPVAANSQPPRSSNAIAELVNHVMTPDKNAHANTFEQEQQRIADIQARIEALHNA
jgi:hypothetical protein